jgi:hypothetical protein
MSVTAPPSRRRRVLIVSPHFPPINAPDMQRVRMALPFLPQLGWDPVVLAVQPAYAGSGVLDPLLEKTYPSDIRIIRVGGWSPRQTRWLGVGSLWWRCGASLRRAAEELLAREDFDLVFFSTTQFDAFTLGPRWLKRFGVPYVVDYQDPWVNTYYHRTGMRPPGGWLKYNFTQWLARRREPQVVRHAGAIVTVSDAYERYLADAYPDVRRELISLLPFGIAPADFTVAASHRPERPLIDFADGNFHFVYAGRCGPNMSLAMSILFQAFRKYLDSHPEQARRMRFHFIGTDYAPPPAGREWAMPTARAEGVSEYVHEECYRVPYFDALHYLLRADSLIIVGSNDSTYTASKLFPYLLARRPLLVLFHRESLVFSLAREIGVASVIGFKNPDSVPALANLVYSEWFVQGGCHRLAHCNEEKLSSFSARSVTEKLARCFYRAVAESGTP